MQAEPFGAIVLTGGGGARLGGADKASIELGGRTLLEHALTAVKEASEVVVVGEQVPTSRPATFTREDPEGGGPAAGLVAGLGCFARHPVTVVALAVDMPLVTTETVRRLVEAAVGEGAVLVDPEGRRQYLCAAYRTAALEGAVSAVADSGVGRGHGLSMRSLVADLDLVEVPGSADETRDLDTWQDLRDLRLAFGE